MVQSSKDLETMLSDPKRALFHMAVPLFIALLIANLQTFIDSLWCAGLGPDPLSAISMAAPVYRIIVSMGLAVGVGSSGAIALALGKQDKERADSTASQAIVASLLISLVIIVVMLLCGEFLVTISGNGYNTDLAMTYLQPFIVCTIPLVINGLVIGLVRSEGAAKKSMMISLIASVFNIVLDPIFIYYLGWGLEGAAWSTCVSITISTLAGISLYVGKKMYLSPDLRHFRFRKDLIKDISVVAVPFAIEALLICLMIIPENGIVASCGGPEGLAIYVNAFNFVNLAVIPAAGLASALIPLISAQLGQRSTEKIKATFRYSLTAVVAIGTALGLVMFIFAPQLASLYTYTEEMKALEEEIILAIRIYSVTPIFIGMIRIASSMIQALRRAVVSTVLMFVREIFFITFYLIAAQYSMEMIYWSVDLTNVLAAILMMSVTLMVVKQLVKKESK